MILTIDLIAAILSGLLFNFIDFFTIAFPNCSNKIFTPLNQ